MTKHSPNYNGASRTNLHALRQLFTHARRCVWRPLSGEPVVRAHAPTRGVHGCRCAYVPRVDMTCTVGCAAVLMLGRLFGGIATSLLFSAFESWMVSEHNRQFGHDPEYSKTA